MAYRGDYAADGFIRRRTFLQGLIDLGFTRIPSFQGALAHPNTFPSKLVVLEYKNRMLPPYCGLQTHRHDRLSSNLLLSLAHI